MRVRGSVVSTDVYTTPGGNVLHLECLDSTARTFWGATIHVNGLVSTFPSLYLVQTPSSAHSFTLFPILVDV